MRFRTLFRSTRRVAKKITSAHTLMLAGFGYVFVHCQATLTHRASAIGATIERYESSAESAQAAPASAPDSTSLGKRRFERVVHVDTPSQKALETALREARGPVIIVLPAGRFTIDSPLVVRADDVLLVGAGPGATVFGRPDGFSSDQREAAFVRASGTKRLQISGIRFEGGAANPKTKDVGILLEDAESFRVDHCQFSKLGFAGVRVNGASRGVIDHSSFEASYKPEIGTDGYGVAVFGTDVLEGVPLGAGGAETRTFNATFIEDCTFSLCRHAVASNKGARYVFRKNRVTDGVVAHAVDAHGAEYGSRVGTEWIDVYDNVLEQSQHRSPFYDGWAVRIRGGRGAVHDNVIDGYRTTIELTEQTTEKTGPVHVWNNTLRAPAAARASKHGRRTVPLSEAPPAGYTPHAYPHPLASTGACDPARNLRVGWADVCSDKSKEP